MATGCFIALEGIDGSGTTTAQALCADALRARGCKVLTTAEPSTGKIGLLIRDALTKQWQTDGKALGMLFAADRLDHLHTEIQPALSRGEIVICDRYLLSSLCYQGGNDTEDDWVKGINSRARDADLNILVRVDPEVAAQRRAQRGGEPEHFEADDLQRQIAARYERLLADHAGHFGEVAVVDGECAPEVVCQRIVELIESVVSGCRK